MRRLRILAAGAALIVAAPESRAASDNVPPPGFRALFNGEDLSGWRGRPHLDPRVEAAWSPEERERAEKGEPRKALKSVGEDVGCGELCGAEVFVIES